MTDTLRDELAAAQTRWTAEDFDYMADRLRGLEDYTVFAADWADMAKQAAADLRAATPSNASVCDSVRDSAGAGDGWRPIASAPKHKDSGLSSLALGPKILVCRYGVINTAWWDIRAEKWCLNGTGRDAIYIHETNNPSHWMPLPAAPSQPHGEGQP